VCDAGDPEKFFLFARMVLQMVRVDLKGRKVDILFANGASSSTELFSFFERHSDKIRILNHDDVKLTQLSKKRLKLKEGDDIDLLKYSRVLFQESNCGEQQVPQMEHEDDVIMLDQTALPPSVNF